MADFSSYDIYLGSFEGNNFVWKKIKTYNDLDKARKYYQEFCLKQASYTAEELSKVWSSGRIDIELKKDKKLLNWTGMYVRIGYHADEEEVNEDETEKHTSKKESTDK